jgi:hypothetical protein
MLMSEYVGEQYQRGEGSKKGRKMDIAFLKHPGHVKHTVHAGLILVKWRVPFERSIVV